jgi:D-inositol-3-phosphate glycosyltransferase
MLREPALNRIALLSLHSSPLAVIGRADAGGMNVYVRRMADELSSIGIHVDVYTRRTDPHAPEVLRTKDGARIVHLDGGPRQELPKSVLPLHIRAMAASFRSFVERERLCYDVLHTHYWLSGLVALRCRDVADAPIVHMFHTLSKVKEFYNGGPDPKDSGLRFDGERSVIAGADVVVGATAMEREQMEHFYGRAPRSFSVIPLGVDLDLFRPRDRTECRRSLDISADRVIVFVGRPDSIKGLDTLLLAIGALPSHLQRGLRLIVVGDAGTERALGGARYRRLVRTLGVADAVEFRGIVSQHELAPYYSAADICAVPSAYESFGMVAVESMACQTPVVAFSVGGLAATIRDGHTGFLAAAGDRSGYAAKLAAALSSPALAEMGRRARLSVRPYEWSTIVERTLELYERVTRRSLLCCGLSRGY